MELAQLDKKKSTVKPAILYSTWKNKLFNPRIRWEGCLLLVDIMLGAPASAINQGWG